MTQNVVKYQAKYLIKKSLQTERKQTAQFDARHFSKIFQPEKSPFFNARHFDEIFKNVNKREKQFAQNREN